MDTGRFESMLHESDSLTLAQKYSCQAPRYTSYPTALQFRDDFAVQTYVDWVKTQARRDEPLSLYIHIPFCRDICYYCACNKTVSRKEDDARRYLDHLKTELTLQSKLLGKKRKIVQMHWGGGTPTYLSNAQITELVHLLATHFQLLADENQEYAIEIDPRTVNTETIALLRGLGFNRVSLGIQDFDPLVQKAINRLQPYSDVEALVNCIRGHGFESLSFDLIHGLPHQDGVTTRETIAKVLKLRPDRIACYNYAHLPERFLSQRAIDRLALPSPRQRLAQQLWTSKALCDAGYVHIGMDHYVLPEDELAKAQQNGRLQRNFQGYSVRKARDILGLGVSSISQMGDFYLQNTRELPAYYQACKQKRLPVSRGLKLNREDRLRRHVIMSLICQLKLDIRECEERFNIDFRQHFAQALSALTLMAKDELVHIERDQITVPERGRAFLRNICLPFDTYHRAATANSSTVSRVHSLSI
ncbi:MAG: oxygen-independent coproporphyrinogen III oxidase [Gammaproteobacteria bacterium]|nr:MAG: oxygen-independent coproporphyrinogen III oxidase [Gammaproteobacteria bacterium]